MTAWNLKRVIVRDKDIYVPILLFYVSHCFGSTVYTLFADHNMGCLDKVHVQLLFDGGQMAAAKN